MQQPLETAHPIMNEEGTNPGGSRAAIRSFIQKASRAGSSRPQDDIPLPPGPFPFVIAIIPAYNEQDSILRTIASLNGQTRRPDEIIVLADNFTDDTIPLVLAAGITVVETQGNPDGKAGALNGLLDQILPLLDADDCIVVMDADTVLCPRFVEATTTTLYSESRKPIAGVGGIFLADDAPWNLVRQLQSNEYVRYQRRLRRRRGRALVLTGTGTAFKTGVLREVKNARATGELPDLGETRGVYDTSALTEDNELTLSVKQLGYRVLSPMDCTVETAMMPTVGSLFKQRLRWQRGALENLMAHGINTHTFPYLARQILTYLGVLFVPFYLYTLTIAILVSSGINFLQPLWVLVAVVYLFEQTLSVRAGGLKAIAVSLSVIPEILLNMFLNVVYVVAALGALFATREAWGRVRNLGRQRVVETGGPPALPAVSATESLHGTHRARHGFFSRIGEIVTLIVLLSPFVVAAILPWINLQWAWWIVAGYVLVGFAATLARLVPVKTS